MHKNKLPKAEKTFLCIECGAKFWENKSLQLHVARNHEIQNLACSLCSEDQKKSKKLYSKAMLERHIKFVHEKTNQCSLCDYEYSRKEKFREHFLSKHMNYFQFRCRACSKEFGKLINAKYHYQQVHLNNSSRKLDSEYFEKNSSVIENKKHTDPKYPSNAQIEEVAKGTDEKQSTDV